MFHAHPGVAPILPRGWAFRSEIQYPVGHWKYPAGGTGRVDGHYT